MEIENEDGNVSPFTIHSVCKQAGLTDDDMMQARIKRLKSEAHADLHNAIKFDADEVVHYCGKLRQIIANMYQIAGAHDCPEHILDVLADPEGTTDEQVDAMLPYTGGA